MTTRTKVGIGGHIAGDDVLILTSRVPITAATGRTWDHAAPNHGTGVTDLAARPGFGLSWGRFPGPGASIATSGTNPDGAYVVSLAACECRATSTVAMASTGQS
jgi:hypothetical protein